MLETPLNTAVIVEEPRGSEVVVNVAVPAAVTGSVASTVPPCTKLTVPPVTGAVRVLTAAVKVTGWPGLLGLPEPLNCVVVSDCRAVSVTDRARIRHRERDVAPQQHHAVDDVLEDALDQRRRGDRVLSRRPGIRSRRCPPAC